MPEGYEYQEEGPYGGKWHNKETNSGISIIPYNAAELYKMSRVDENSFRKFRKESRVKTSRYREYQTGSVFDGLGICGQREDRENVISFQ